MKHFFATCLTLVTLVVQAQQVAVIPGDYPDPSVTKIGDTYWASATSSNWFPAYPLLKSKDLINWQTTGFVFEKKPDWADFYFWAPEISHENGKTYIYYAAHKKGGNLCVGVASADRPEGPYRDHGPLVCQSDGSIDAFPMRDENGKLYLIWKEDGNSIRQPTPIWAQAINEERTALVGDKKELFRNEKPWEANLVEGVSMIRHGSYFYAFYAAAGCCGNGCTYVSGVARAKSLLGPWEKYDKNPLLTSDKDWKCPGHGTPIEKEGKFYFLYHAYNTESSVYAGRQALLREFRFTNDGWIDFGALVPASEETTRAAQVASDDFGGKQLSTAWNWSVFHQPQFQVKKGQLSLTAQPNKFGNYLGHRSFTANYTAQTTITIPQKGNAPETGLALIGDDDNAVGISFSVGQVQVWKMEKGKNAVLHSATLSTQTRTIQLKATVSNGKDVVFAYSTDGKAFTTLNAQAINGAYLPPWDRAVRVGLTAKGEATQQAVFDDFRLEAR